MLTGNAPETWPEYLLLVLQAARCASSKTMGFSPYTAVFGKQPATYVDLFFPF